MSWAGKSKHFIVASNNCLRKSNNLAWKSNEWQTKNAKRSRKFNVYSTATVDQQLLVMMFYAKYYDFTAETALVCQRNVYDFSANAINSPSIQRITWACNVCVDIALSSYNLILPTQIIPSENVNLVSVNLLPHYLAITMRCIIAFPNHIDFCGDFIIHSSDAIRLQKWSNNLMKFKCAYCSCDVHSLQSMLHLNKMQHDILTTRISPNRNLYAEKFCAFPFRMQRTIEDKEEKKKR